MAYVGTPTQSGSPVYTIASVLQGEAGGQGRVGMMAVASVMQNRASMNLNGYGGDILSQVLAPNQFQGQAVPGAQALSVANQLYSGNLNDITGGALYYANPGASSASWARNLTSSNSLQIGAHNFTDNIEGVPFSPDVSPGDLAAEQNGSSIIPGDGLGSTPFVASPDAAGDDLTGYGWLSGGSGDGGSGVSSPASLGGLALPTDSTSPDYTLDPGIASAAGADPTALAGSPDTTAAGTIYSPTDTSYAAITQDDQTAGQTFAASSTSQSPSSETVPQAIDNQTKGAAADTTAANKAIQGAAQVIQSSAKLVAQTTKDTEDKADSSMKNIFTRATMVITGLVFLAAGLWLFAHPEELSGLKSSLQPA